MTIQGKAALFLVLILSAVVTGPAQAEDFRLVLRLSIVTGDDDLRGGNDNVLGSYRLGSTWSTPVLLNRRAMRWPDRSRQRADLELPATPVAMRTLNAIRLQTTFGGGMGGDNWNMDQLYVQVCSVPATLGPCIDVARHGPKRFTGSDKTLIVPIAMPSSRIEK